MVTQWHKGLLMHKCNCEMWLIVDNVKSKCLQVKNCLQASHCFYSCLVWVWLWPEQSLESLLSCIETTSPFLLLQDEQREVYKLQGHGLVSFSQVELNNTATLSLCLMWFNWVFVCVFYLHASLLQETLIDLQQVRSSILHDNLTQELISSSEFRSSQMWINV